MPRLTDEEYAALDEKWKLETPMVNCALLTNDL